VADERIDIEITDKVSPAPARKLREIASEAIAADSAIDRLKASLASVNAAPLEKLATASSRLANAQAKEMSAAARLESARARSIDVAARAAVNEQRLATERERTAAAAMRAEAALNRAVSAENAAATSAARLQSAVSSANAAQERAAQASLATEAALSRAVEAETRAAQASQRLAAEKAKTAAAEARATAEAERAASAATNAAIASERLAQAQNRTAASANAEAVATSRLSAEQAREEAAKHRAATASAQAAAASARAESAALRLAAAKRKEAAATAGATGATSRNTAANRANAASSGLAAHQTSNLVFQLQDVVVGLQAGQSPMTVFLQQGTQIAGVFGPGAGVTGILRGLAAAARAMIAPFLPVIAVVGTVAAGFGILTKAINDATDASAFDDLRSQVQGLDKDARDAITVGITMGDVFRATMQLIGEAVYEFVQPAINAIAPWITRGYNFIRTATKTVVNGIVGAFVGTYNAIGALWGTDFPVLFEAGWKTAFNALLDGVSLLTRGVIAVFKNQINTVVGLFKGGYDAFVAVWGLLPAAFRRLGALAMNGLIDLVERGVRGVITAVDELLTFIGSAAELVGLDNPFANILNPESIDLSEYRQNVGEPVGEQMAAAITDSFTNALSQDYATKLADALDVTEYRQELSGAARDAAGAVNDAYRDAFSVDYAGSALGAIRARAQQIARERIAAQIEEANAGGAGAGSRSNAEMSRKQEILQEIRKPLTEFIEDTAALNELLAEGAITAGQYNQALASLSLVQSLRDVDASLVGTPYAEQAALDEIRIAEQERLNVVQMALEARIISEEEANARIVAINRQAATDARDAWVESQSAILTTMSGAFGSLADSIKGFAGEQSAAYKVMFAASKAFAIADSIIKIQQGIANALALPWPANIPAIATVVAEGASIISAINSVAGIGFKTGGYTGNGGVNDVAGVVHGREYVMNAQTVRNVGVGTLDRIQRSGEVPTRAYRAPEASRAAGMNVRVENYGTPQEYDVKQISETDVILIARDVAKKAVRDEAPGVISADMGNPNSRTSRALGQYTTTQRRR